MNLAGLVVSADNNIYVARRTSVGVFQANFRERRPSCTGRKKEICCIVSNYPFLAETNRTSDNNFAFMKNAANTQRILRFVFRAIGNFVVERAEALGSVAISTRACVTRRKSEDFCEWMLKMCLGHHVRKRLDNKEDRHVYGTYFKRSPAKRRWRGIGFHSTRAALLRMAIFPLASRARGWALNPLNGQNRLKIEAAEAF
jgi:hypothetical protein